jgi:hypothetical protein
MSRTGLTALLAAATLLLPASFALSGVYGKGVPTREKYVSRAEKVCKGTNKKMNKLSKRSDAALKKGDNKTAGEEIVAVSKVFGKGVRHLGALVRPPADKAVLKGWIASLRADVKLLTQLGKIVGKNGVGELSTGAIERSSAHAAQTNALVADFGFKNCLING